MSKTTKRTIQALMCMPTLLSIGFLMYVMLGGQVSVTQTISASVLLPFSLILIFISIGLEIE